MWGEIEFKIQEEIIELHLDQACFSSGMTTIEALTEPSTNPSLLLASKAILLAIAQVGLLSSVRGWETKIALGVSPWCKKNRLQGSSIGESSRWEEEDELVSIFDTIDKGSSSDTM